MSNGTRLTGKKLNGTKSKGHNIEREIKIKGQKAESNKSRIGHSEIKLNGNKVESNKHRMGNKDKRKYSTVKSNTNRKGHYIEWEIEKNGNNVE